MRIQPQIYKELQKHCAASLLMKLSGLNVNPLNDNVWDITSLTNDIDMMKIAYAFENVGGTLIYEGNKSQYVIITRDMDVAFSTDIRLFWIHNEANGVCPIYDIGAVEVPPILPKYVSTPREDGTFIVERLNKGEYKPLNGMVFLFETESKAKARELNDEYSKENAPE